MSDERSEVQKALSLLCEEVELKESADEAAARRARVVGRLQTLNRELPRRRLMARIGPGLALSAAAVLAAYFFLGRSFSSEDANRLTAKGEGKLPLDVAPPTLRIGSAKGSPNRSSAGKSERLTAGRSVEVEALTSIETAAGEEARVEGGRGLNILVREGSFVEVQAKPTLDGANELRLMRGAVDCSVDPRGLGPKLAVVTPDARVVVKGTVFQVELLRADDGRQHTCVRVSRGVVGVSQGDKSVDVTAGNEFGCATRSSEPEVSPPPGKASPTMAPSLKQSTLADQNAAFARGLAAERAGRLADAEAEFARLLRKYPETLLRADIEAALTRVRSNRGKTP